MSCLFRREPTPVWDRHAQPHRNRCSGSVKRQGNADSIYCGERNALPDRSLCDSQDLHLY